MSPYLTCLGKVARRGAQVCLGGAAGPEGRNAPAPSCPRPAASPSPVEQGSGCPDRSLPRHVELSRRAPRSHALHEYISHVIRKINNNNKKSPWLGRVSHQQGSITAQSARRAAAAVTLASGAAAGHPPHPFSGGFAPFLLLVANPLPCRGACTPRASSPGRKQAEPCTQHVETPTFPFIPNGTSQSHWVYKVLPWQRKEKQTGKAGTEESTFEKGRGVG